MSKRTPLYLIFEDLNLLLILFRHCGFSRSVAGIPALFFAYNNLPIFAFCAVEGSPVRRSLKGSSREQWSALIASFGSNTTIFARRSSLQTLLVGVVCVGVVGLLRGHDGGYPGRRSLRLACPGLYYVAPLGLKRTEAGSPTMRRKSRVLESRW
jgi:hypothetical protein